MIFNKNEKLTDDQLKEVHILAQIANSVCQKKIGSGFDIAAAIYGNLIFKRYNANNDLPEIIEALDSLSSLKKLPESYDDSNLYDNYTSFFDNFTFEPTKFHVPKFFNLCMVYTSSGSDTRVMVKNLMQWSKDNIDSSHSNTDTIFSQENWQSLSKLNNEVIEIFATLK